MTTIGKTLAPLVLAATLCSAAPAFAYSSFCFTDAFPAFIFDCPTNAVPANDPGHFVHYEIGAYGNYNVHDVNGPIVAFGITGAYNASATIFGLYSAYYVTVSGPATWAYINNT